MKKIIEYYYIKSDHIFASPEYDHNEMIEVSSDEELKKYIESQKDWHGHRFKKDKNRFMKFDYISNAGAVRVKNYVEPKFKKV